MLWIKSFHLIAMICWFAGLFYLPRLFVYHAMANDIISLDRFKIMERKLYYGIMTPAALLTVGFGIGLMHYNTSYYEHARWFQFKMAGVGLLALYHFYCGYLMRQFKLNKNTHSHVYYRVLNELPVVLLALIIILVCVKP